MVDIVTSQLIENGQRNFVYHFTSLSDGTGESAVAKVDGSATGPLGVLVAGQTTYPTIHLKIREIDFQVLNMSLQLLWDANVDQTIVVLGVGAQKLNYDRFGGLCVPPGLVGATGKILFTTLGAMPNASYSVTIRGTKGVPQS